MTDLINKNKSDLSNEELEILKNLVEKYKDLIQYVHHSYANELAFVLEMGINHIKDNHNDLPVDWKTWSMVLLKNMVEDNLNIQNVPTIIDEFVEYHKTEYNKYCKDIISVNDFERDRGFVHRFINKKR